jgi:hypothetical protein
MRSRSLGPLAAALLPLVLFQPAGSQETGLDWIGVADVLSERMDLQAGESVMLFGIPGRFDPLVDALADAIEAGGARYLGAASMSGTPFSRVHTTTLVERLAVASGADARSMLNDVDLAIMLPGATPEHVPYAAMQEVLRGGRGRTIHFHWSGAYAMDGVLFEPDARVDATYMRALTETDYDALAASQARFEAAARAGRVRVTTPAGTDLSFRIGDRPVTRQDGNASARRADRARNLIDREVELPAGAVRVAPIEESVEGVIAFPPGIWGGEGVEGLRMRFESGRMVDFATDEGSAGVERELQDAGPAGRSFRELAVGFNPLLVVPDDDPWIPYYGYGAGVVRLSLGDNSELGGAVGGGYVRWNFFTDATVTIDGEAWVVEGRLIR